MKKSRVVITYKARASLRGYVKYLKQEVSEEVADYVKKGIIANGIPLRVRAK